MKLSGNLILLLLFALGLIACGTPVQTTFLERIEIAYRSGRDTIAKGGIIHVDINILNNETQERFYYIDNETGNSYVCVYNNDCEYDSAGMYFRPIEMLDIVNIPKNLDYNQPIQYLREKYAIDETEFDNVTILFADSDYYLFEGIIDPEGNSSSVWQILFLNNSGKYQPKMIEFYLDATTNEIIYHAEREKKNGIWEHTIHTR